MTVCCAHQMLGLHKCVRHDMGYLLVLNGLVTVDKPGSRFWGESSSSVLQGHTGTSVPNDDWGWAGGENREHSAEQMHEPELSNE